MPYFLKTKEDALDMIDHICDESIFYDDEESIIAVGGERRVNPNKYIGDDFVLLDDRVALYLDIDMLKKVFNIELTTEENGDASERITIGLY